MPMILTPSLAADTICVDMRNHYESEVGHFKGALTPDVDTFRESLPLIEQELAHHKEDKKLLDVLYGWNSM